MTDRNQVFEIPRLGAGPVDAPGYSHATGYHMNDIKAMAFNELWEQSKQPVIQMGNHMISFNQRTPDRDRDILYLLGNALTGVKETCMLVRGVYDPKFGDFERDESGKHMYVTYWRYIQ